MRSFDDSVGGCWQVAVLAGSYGSMWLVFSRAGDSEVRKLALDVDNMGLAEQQLAGTEESELRQLLADSVPWE
ncbi:MAG TPA: hypothetical protein VIL60_08410 [Rhodanobacter sp.]